MVSYAQVIEELKALANPDNVAGMARFGISTTHTLGISMKTLEPIAKRHKKDHVLALQLWDSGIHEARLLAVMIDDPKQVTEAQMEAWVNDFDSWDVCDQACNRLFDKTPFAYQKAVEWTSREATFVKRAGFVLMATRAVHDKKAPDQPFIDFLPIIEREAGDERNFVKKAVNWALRQIGKRNAPLNAVAIQTGEAIRKQDSKAAKWVAADALRELTSAAVQGKLAKQGNKNSKPFSGSKDR
jgi:3-methyladenine DNA glycosylase AlkD